MTQAQYLEQELREQLDWITSRRWFGDKARPVEDLHLLLTDTVPTDTGDLILAVVRLSHTWGEPTTYFLPLLDTNAPLPERDATASKDILRWFVDGFATNRVIAGEGTWTWRQIGSGVGGADDLDDQEIRVITAEQSNSSIVFGHHSIMKLFRRVQVGVNPDIEIGEHLMNVGTFRHAPGLYGVISLDLDGERIDIGALQEFVPNIGDSWSWLLAELPVPAMREQLIEDIRLLGLRTGEMHLALSESAADPEFAPVEIGEEEAQAIIRRIIAEMEGSVEGLTHHLSPPELERLHKGLGAMMGDAWSMVGTDLVRVHGDYHLGQVLRTIHGDFAVIDFEGEPSRTMDERRMKLPALKDVAGMVRSLDYAGATLMQRTDDPLEQATLASWVQDASGAFVAAYREAIKPSPHHLVPESDAAFESVLNLMIAEKALYELRYEMNNRPDWVWIPLDALQRLVGMESID